MKLRELEDFAWFPAILRKYQMELIGNMSTWLLVYSSSITFLRELLVKYRITKITDLCSGSGLPAIHIHDRLKDVLTTTTLTDIYPQTPIVSKGVTYLSTPVDVLKVIPEEGQLYTMYNSFHHFSESEMRQLIKKLTESKSKFLIVEILRPDWLSFLQVTFASTLGVLIFTPFIRPFEWKRLFFTYIIPLNIFTVLIDGWISVIKSKSVSSYASILSDFCQENTISIQQHFNFPAFVIQLKNKE